LLDALAGVDRSAGLAYLTGLAAGYAQRAAEMSVETVWSGPGSHHVPVRATAAVLADVIREACRELLLMTYSARQYEPLTVALRTAVNRGVHVSVVVETLQGAGSALAGDEPYQAFTGITGIDLWHWPSAKRTEPGAKIHAKLAVADRCVLFVISANLTQSGVGKNIEAGLLVRGGTAPLRCPLTLDLSRRQAADLGWLSFSSRILDGRGRWSATESEPSRRPRPRPDGLCLASPRDDVLNLSIAALQISGPSASAVVTWAALRRRRPTFGGSTCDHDR